jgi:3-isopropylmalate/(R)-2-methylmalate dehydratase small subunit
VRPFTTHEGVAAVLWRHDVDTDAIIPSREMTSVGKTGLAAGLFANWRYLDVPERTVDAASRTPDPAFVLNQPRQQGTTILIAGRNFGCGSSREHAVWALAEWGIRAIVAPSFGAIFFDNCVRNGLLPVVLEEAQAEALAHRVQADSQGQRLHIDLALGELRTPGAEPLRFTLAAEAREMLLTGLDPIERTLQSLAAIERFEAGDRVLHPWLYLAADA